MKIFRKEIIFAFIALFILFLGIFIYKLKTYTYISAKFKALRPIHQTMAVYFKGIKVGHAKEKFHSFDFNHTYIKIVLYKNNFLFPSNTEVYLKKEKKDDKVIDFLELVYPDNPSKEIIRNGAILQGTLTSDVDTFLANQRTDDLELIQKNLVESSTELNNMLYSLGSVLDSLNELIKGLNEVAGDIRTITKENRSNIYSTTKNLKNITDTADKAIDNVKINNSITNIETLSSNLVDTLDNINGTTLAEVDNILNNTSSITCGLRKTLSKRFGGLRLFFGKVIE